MTRKEIHRPRHPLLPKVFTAFRAARLCCLLSITLLAACQMASPQRPESPASQPASGDSTAAGTPADTPSHSPTARGAQRAATDARTDAGRAPEIPDDSHTIYFPPRVTTVDQIGKEKLRQHAEHLKQNPKRTLVLSGHTDDLGSRSYNLIIAEERIAAVGKLLRAYGVPNRQIQRKSVHKDKSPADCISPDCRQKMRRVELIYLP